MGGSAGFLVHARSSSEAPGTPATTKTPARSAPPLLGPSPCPSPPRPSPPPPRSPTSMLPAVPLQPSAATAGMPPFVEAAYRELARHLSGPNSLAILEATATTAGVRRDRLGPRHLTELIAHVQASFGFFGVPEDHRDACLNRLRDLASGSNAEPSSGPVVVPIRQEPDIVRARLAGKLLCRKLRFSDGCTTKVVTAISELARNVFKHAGKGSVTVRGTPGEPPGIEVVATDSGPGIADVDALLAAGRSSTGAGLRGTRDLADSFEIVSRPGTGTTVTFRKTRLG